MSEHMSPIPSRIYNAAVGGHVAGADQIIDDETGLTLDKVTGGALEEKTYTSSSNNGMGRVVLRKNLVEGVNTLTQAMINKSNTIYVIQYDFTLGEDIIVPANCVLEFEGGSIISLSSKTITGSNTVIDTPIGKIFNTNIQLIGSWNVNAFIPQWWGAKGDGLNDDTDAIQCAIDSIYKGVEDSTQESYWTKPCTSVYIPRPKYGYRITKTISLVEKWNFRFYSDTINVTDRSQHSSDFATFIWDGPTNTPMMLFSYTLYGTVENISLNGKKIDDVVGIKLGVLNTQNSSVGNVSFNKIVIMYCSSGVVVGTPGSDVAPDCADIYFRDCIFRHNKYWGIEICGGNTECSLINCNCGDNGITANLSENEDGGNIKSYNAETFIYGYISGGNSTHIPKTADIFQYGGGIRIYGAWSDTPGIFLKSTRCTSAAIMSGVRHYEGSMTTENTPVSVKWRGPQTLVIEGCYLYNNVEHESGQGGSIVDIGTRFVTSDAGFIGAELSSNPSALTSISNGLKVGNSKLPTNVPSAVTEYLKAKKYITHRLVSDGIGYLSEALNSDGSIYSFMYNAYTNNVGQKKALVAGGVHQIEVAWNSNINAPTFRIYGGVASNIGDTVRVAEVFAFKGNNTKKCLFIDGHYITWGGQAPSSGTWGSGDICYNTNVTSGNPYFWIHNGTAWISGPLVP